MDDDDIFPLERIRRYIQEHRNKSDSDPDLENIVQCWIRDWAEKFTEKDP